MNKQTYKIVRRSIRDNGLSYTAHWAVYTDNAAAIFVCDDLANLMRETDWLAMRAMFARSCAPAIAFRLTTH